MAAARGATPAARIGEADALEEHPAAGIVVLVGLQDVGVVLEQGAGHARDQARPIGSADEQRQDAVALAGIGGGGVVVHGERQHTGPSTGR